MAEVFFLKHGTPATRLNPATDSIRLSALGIGVAAVPSAGVIDCLVGVDLNGVDALSYTTTTLTIGGTGWTTSQNSIVGSAATFVFTHGSKATLTFGRSTDAVTFTIDSAASSVAFQQTLLSSGTPANWTISAQSVTTGTGASLTLAGGTGSANTGPVIIKAGALEIGRFTGVFPSGSGQAALLLNTTSNPTDLIFAATFGTTLAIRSQSGAYAAISLQTGSSSGGTGWQIIDGAGALVAYYYATGSTTSYTAVGLAYDLSTNSGTNIHLPPNSPDIHICSSTMPASGGSGILSWGIVTTAPTASVADQAVAWAASGGLLNIMGKTGLSVLIGPTSGTTAPVLIGGFIQSGRMREPKNTIPELFDDFISTVVGGNTGWTAVTVGTASNITVTPTLVDASHWGMRLFDLGSTTTGVVSMHWGLNQCLINANDWNIEYHINIPTLSTTLQEYRINAGFQDGTAIGAPTSGCYFEYLRSTSVNWRFGGIGAGSPTAVASSSTAVGTGWNRLRITKIGSTATFYVNDVSIGTNTAWTSAVVGPCIKLSGNVTGTSTRIMYLDCARVSAQLTTAR